jgi:hypothetical protein
MTHTGGISPTQALYGQPQLGKRSTKYTEITGDQGKLRVAIALETISVIGPTHSPTAEYAS